MCRTPDVRANLNQTPNFTLAAGDFRADEKRLLPEPLPPHRQGRRERGDRSRGLWDLLGEFQTRGPAASVKVSRY